MISFLIKTWLSSEVFLSCNYSCEKISWNVGRFKMKFRSFMTVRNKRGPRLESWGTSGVATNACDLNPLYATDRQTICNWVNTSQKGESGLLKIDTIVIYVLQSEYHVCQMHCVKNLANVPKKNGQVSHSWFLVQKLCSFRKIRFRTRWNMSLYIIHWTSFKKWRYSSISD